MAIMLQLLCMDVRSEHNNNKLNMSRRGLKIIEDETQLPLTHFIPNTLSAPVTTDNTVLVHISSQKWSKITMSTTLCIIF